MVSRERLPCAGAADGKQNKDGNVSKGGTWIGSS